LTETKPSLCKCKWDEEPEYLEKHKEKVNKLARTRVSNIKKALWENASVMLRERGYTYSPKQYSIKWKNIKRNYKVRLSFFFLKKKVKNVFQIYFDKFNCLI
jgi:hypothetical protein